MKSLDKVIREIEGESAVHRSAMEGGTRHHKRFLATAKRQIIEWALELLSKKIDPTLQAHMTDDESIEWATRNSLIDQIEAKIKEEK